MGTLRIAMVDDTATDRRWLSEHLEEYLRSRHIPYSLSAFENGEDFLSAILEQWFDIVFMDIYMTGITGLETATSLRAKDRDCKLIFLTSSPEHMYQGFSLNSAHYLIKPVQEKDFLQAMENCRIRRICQVPLLSVVSERTTIQIDTLDIFYIDIHNRLVTIHTKEGLLKAGRNFTQIAEQLSEDQRFLLCNKGLLVNMDFIAALEDRDFVLVDGNRLPLAPRRKKEITDQYYKYTFGNLGEYN